MSQLEQRARATAGERDAEIATIESDLKQINDSIRQIERATDGGGGGGSGSTGAEGHE